ncbi:AMP-binding protein [Microscilla marina]|uniref:AMP-ligase n=1 Tax=Microscilla marina ATCC 23134 TaxID=313606 RepID=A1ZKN2_MICM2|nr:AMP-binding protein [Microscilla marina]EAY29258.1 AMP-ligase [Microscilla marina ATCC 23134]
MKTKLTNISELFLNATKKHPNNVAIIDKNDQPITYAQLAEDVKATAAYFQRKGIGKGDRVLVFVPMGIDLYRIVLALFYIGATAVFLDEWVSKKRMELCCQLADCKGFIGVWKARAFALFSKELRRIPIKLSLKKKHKTGVPIAQVPPDTTALITFTTGSTGIPKAANRTHAFLREQFDALLEEIHPKVRDVDMPVLPIVLFVNLGVGCTSVIADFKMTKPEAIDEAVIIEQITKHQVNRMIASPFFIKRLAQYTIEQKVELPQINKVVTGGAPVFPQEATLYVKAFPQATSMVVYGSTEVEPISSIDAQTLSQAPETLPEGLPVGEIFHKTEVRIIRVSDGNIPACSALALDEMTLEDDVIGEIIVAGAHVLKQYFKNDAAFRQNKIIVGNKIWHRTGDSGLKKGNQLLLTGRCAQLIEFEGGYLSPFIIENQLVNIAGVTMGTLLEMNQQRILVLESVLNKEVLAPKMGNIPYDKLQVVAQIPRDARHHSKIDYGALKLQLGA